MHLSRLALISLHMSENKELHHDAKISIKLIRTCQKLNGTDSMFTLFDLNELQIQDWYLG